jgi:hypothetical protein
MLKKKFQECSEDEYIKINHDKGESDYLKVEHHAADGLKTDKENNKTEYRNEKAENEKYNDKVEGATAAKYFCVFRVGKGIKTLNQVAMFEKHMERDLNVPNADIERTRYNRIFIGDKNVTQNVKEYIYGIRTRLNGNIANDLILTAGNGFFNNLSPHDKERWIQANVDFVKKNFGDNCIYMCLHLDETTAHFHNLIVSKFYDENKKKYKLQSNKYFGSKEKLRDWQDKYYDYMHNTAKFNNLIRGVRGSKAKHISIQTWYTLTGKPLNIKDKGQLLAYAQKAYLLEKRTKALEETLTKMQENKDTDKLLKKLKGLEKNNKEYKEITKEIIKKYEIKENDIKDILDKVLVKNNSEERVK